MILGDIIERNARCFPNDPAILFEGRAITHAQFASRVRRLANALDRRGVPRQARVAVLAQNCPEYLEVFGVGELAGTITCGLNYRLSAAEQADILRDCQPAAIVFEAQYADRVAELRSALPAGAPVICIGDPVPSWAEAYETTVDSGPDTPPRIRANEGDTVFLIYTSGTTGRAKGVMLSNRGQLEQARVLSATQAAQQDDRMLIVMPFYHIGGKTEQLSFALAGATIVLHRAFDAAAVLESMERHRVTAAHLAPTMIQMMLEVQERRPCDVSRLHTVCYASAPMSVALSQRAIAVFGRIFMQIYGMTEQGLGTALLKHQHHTEGSQAGRLASAGQAMFGVDIRVTRDDGSNCAVGEIGEVWMRSPALMQGYWRNPEATAEAIGTGWMRSGDLGYFDDEHFLFIVDRKKDMIISGGENIYSREVEETLLLHPAVLEAAVIGVPDPKWGESVKAFVALRPGAEAREAELIEHCRAKIASYKKPRSIEVMAALPRLSSTNKIDKKRLREPYWAAQARQVS